MQRIVSMKATPHVPAVRPKKANVVIIPLPIEQTQLNTWFERDRQRVELLDARNDETIVEWWDEAVSEAVEDGFLSPRDYHSSAYHYAASVGLLPVVDVRQRKRIASRFDGVTSLLAVKSNTGG